MSLKDLANLQSSKPQAVGVDGLEKQEAIAARRSQPLKLDSWKPVIPLMYFTEEAFNRDHPEYVEKMGLGFEEMTEALKLMQSNVVNIVNTISVNFDKGQVENWNDALPEGQPKLSSWYAFQIPQSYTKDNCYGRGAGFEEMWKYDPVLWFFQNARKLEMPLDWDFAYGSKTNRQFPQFVQSAYSLVWELLEGELRFIKTTLSQVKGLKDDYYRTPVQMQLESRVGGNKNAKVIGFRKLTVTEDHKMPDGDIKNVTGNLSEMVGRSFGREALQLSLITDLDNPLNCPYYNRVAASRRYFMDLLGLQNKYPKDAVWVGARYDFEEETESHEEEERQQEEIL